MRSNPSEIGLTAICQLLFTASFRLNRGLSAPFPSSPISGLSIYTCPPSVCNFHNCLKWSYPFPHPTPPHTLSLNRTLGGLFNASGNKFTGSTKSKYQYRCRNK